MTGVERDWSGTIVILEAILDSKREEIRRLCRQYSGESLVFGPMRERHRFRDALVADGGVGVIAEIKRASPTRGAICDDLDPSELAAAYVRGTASAVSVLTDGPHFQGSREDLEEVRSAVRVPVLRKDFIIDELQVLESRQMGADAILLILSALPQERAEKLMYVADSLDLDCLIEVHTQVEFQRALDLGAQIIGVNNRDLRTFETDVSVTLEILEAAGVADGVVIVSESGISSKHQVEALAASGVDAVLVGEALARSRCPEWLIAEMRSVKVRKPREHARPGFGGREPRERAEPLFTGQEPGEHEGSRFTGRSTAAQMIRTAEGVQRS